MKRVLTLTLMALIVLYALSSCGCDDGRDTGLVFINDSAAVIVTVVVDFQDQNGGTLNADSSPLRRGESFGFEAGEYPVTVYIYGEPVYDVVEGALARVTIEEAPPEGERWYVTARDGGNNGLVLTVGTEWPDGV